mmetsp:Transcript_81371/g.235265  ORF Transcript_81371/g.235265 Transcript_81371/m.235265 type:complete len:264 (+) Transcript_81371:149-940(+)
MRLRRSWAPRADGEHARLRYPMPEGRLLENKGDCRGQLVLSQVAVLTQSGPDKFQALLVPNLLVWQIRAALGLDRHQHSAEALEGAARIKRLEDAFRELPPLRPTPAHSRPAPLGGGRLGEHQVQEPGDAALLVVATLEDGRQRLPHRVDLDPVALDELGENFRHRVSYLGLHPNGNNLLQNLVLLRDGDVHRGPHLNPLLFDVRDDARLRESAQIPLQCVLVDLPVVREDALAAELAQQRIQRVRLGEVSPRLRAPRRRWRL